MSILLFASAVSRINIGIRHILIVYPLFALGGMGGGDVKLLAAIGTWLGPFGALQATLWASITGGVLAIVVGIAGQRVVLVLGQ